MTDSTAAIEMIEMREAIEAEIAAMIEISAGALRIDRADLQKEEVRIETAEIIAEAAAMTETGVMKVIETAIEAEIRIEAEMKAGIGDPTKIDKDQIQEIDSRKKDRDRKMGMTMIGIDE